jgi:uncharacterized delta-60 repeat protein
MLSSLAAVVALILVPAAALGAAGDPDTAFNGTGQVTTGFGTTPFHAADRGNAAARDGSGRIYIAGETPANGGDIALIRLTSGGVLDTTFGNQGIATFDVAGGSDDQANAVLIDSSGKLVVAGVTGDGGEGNDFLIARFTSTGAVDTTFGGGDGFATTDFNGTDDTGFGVAELSTGNFVVAGYAYDSEGNGDDFALASYTSAGAPAPGFGSGGKLTTDLGSDQDEAYAVLATSGPKILAAGYTDPADADDAGDFALVRYDGATGALDTSFDGTSGNGNGIVTVSFSSADGNGDYATALALDGSGRIVAGGFAGPGNGDFAVARLSNSDGTLDNTFDSDGKQTVSTPASGATINSQDSLNTLAVQSDDSIVVGGSEGGSQEWVLSRVSSAGALDTGFGTNGFVLTGYSSSSFDDAAHGVFVDEANNKIIAAGTGDSNFAAARYAKADGSLDTTFGTASSGKVEVDIVSPIPSSETAVAAALQPDGKLIVVGPTDAGPTVQNKGDLEFGVARYNTNGTLDQTFGVGGSDGNGLVTTNFGTNANFSGTDDTPAAVAIQPDGKIVVAGTVDPPSPDDGDFAIARYLPNGTPDSTFDGDGRVTTDLTGAAGDSASGVAVEGTPGSSGFRIVVSGTKSLSFSNRAVAVAVYGEDGAPDTTFNGTGVQTTALNTPQPTRGVALQPDGKVLVATTSGGFFPSPVDFAMVRYNADGTLDDGSDGPAGAGFGGGDGIVSTDFAGGYDETKGIAVEDLGAGEVRIALVGRASPDTSGTAAGGVAVYTSDGTLDSTFAAGGPDGDGKLTFPLGAPSNVSALRSVAWQPDGKIVASGDVGTGDFGAARVTAAGALDPTFGGDGLVGTAFPNPNSEQRAGAGLALQPDGRIVVAGGPLTAFGGSNFLVARYLADPGPTTTPPSTTPPPSNPPAKKKKKCKKKKKHRAAAAKKCKKKRK